MVLDPLSIAGLVIAGIDAIIKVGERTTQLIHDVNAFESNSSEMRNLVNDEIFQTRLLRTLLFSECAVYGGKNLFGQFDFDIQQQIEHLYVEIKSKLDEAFYLLDRRYGVSQGSVVTYFQSLPSSSLKFPPGPDHQRSGRTSPSLPDLLKWSLRDKKRVEDILLSFKDRNARLRNKVEVWCFASQLGVSPSHLKHLQTDNSSRGLGFDKNASLRLANAHVDEIAESLEITDTSWNICLKHMEPIEHQGMFAIFSKDSKTYIQENHYYESTLSPIPSHSTESDVDCRTRSRVESLAKLLHQPKNRGFRVPPCIGWKHLPSQSAIAFIFEIHPKPVDAPVSLQRLLYNNDIQPELGDKFRLALGLSDCIAQMHMVQWLHKSFRSDNILLVPVSQADHQVRTSDIIDYLSPWVLGFQFSRREPFFSEGQADFEPTRDIYRHPDRQGNPSQTFNKIHDIYALGVVLLEIGLWKPAIKLEKDMFAKAKNPHAVQMQLIKHAERRLEKKMGRKFKDVVLKCLAGEFGVKDDTKEDSKLQQAFRHQVVEVIEMAADNV